MKLPKFKMPSQRVRGVVYRLLLAVGAFLVGEELITAQQLDLFETVATFVFGLAAANTPLKNEE